MQLPTSITALLVAGFVSTTVSAWRLTLHTGEQCSSQTYHIIEGPRENTGCFTFGEAMPGTTCEQFTNGGWNKGPCTGSFPRTSNAHVRFGTCRIYNAKNCDERYTAMNVVDLQCAKLLAGNQLAVIQSFKCWE